MTIENTAAEAPASRASLLPNALIGLSFLVVAIVFAASSSWYDTFLTVHILFVVVWIGGGLLLTVFGIKAERSRDPAEMGQLTKMAAFAGERIFAPALWRTISDRALNRPDGSYTTKLLDEGVPAVARKVGEEAVEVVTAALAEEDGRVVSEAADLIYHLYVLLASRGLDVAAVEDELRRRAS